jgi:hypothetical protein
MSKIEEALKRATESRNSGEVKKNIKPDVSGSEWVTTDSKGTRSFKPADHKDKKLMKEGKTEKRDNG